LGGFWVEDIDIEAVCTAFLEEKGGGAGKGKRFVKGKRSLTHTHTHTHRQT